MRTHKSVLLKGEVTGHITIVRVDTFIIFEVPYTLQLGVEETLYTYFIVIIFKASRR